MRLIDKITDAAYQQFNIIGEEGQNISLLLYWLPTQQCWYCNISCNGFVANGVQITVSPNILYNYNKIINFGFAVASKDGYDPLSIEDFLTGRISLYLLSTNDVQFMNDTVFV